MEDEENLTTDSTDEHGWERKKRGEPPSRNRNTHRLRAVSEVFSAIDSVSSPCLVLSGCILPLPRLFQLSVPIRAIRGQNSPSPIRGLKDAFPVEVSFLEVEE
jgi:hypothetical protein